MMRPRIPTIKLTPLQMVIVGLCVLVVITFILRYFTNSSDQVAIPTANVVNTTSLPSQSVEIQVVTTPPTPPQEFPLLSVTKKSYTINELTQFLKITSPIGNTAYINAEKTETLVYSDKTKAVSYAYTPKSGEFDVASVTIINTERAIADAKKFLQKIFGDVPLSPDTSSLVYLNASQDEHDSEAQTPPEEASLVIIPFQYKIGEFPVFIDNHSQGPAIVYVDSASNVVKAELSLIQLIPQGSQTIASLSFDEALKQKKNLSVLSVSNPTLTELPYESLRKLTVQSIQIEYRLLSAQSLLVPMYRCKGTAVYTNSDVESEIDFVIPAVQVKTTEN